MRCCVAGRSEGFWCLRLQRQAVFAFTRTTLSPNMGSFFNSATELEAFLILSMRTVSPVYMITLNIWNPPPASAEFKNEWSYTFIPHTSSCRA